MCLTDIPGRKHNKQAICMDSLTQVSPAPEDQELINNFPEPDHEAKKAFTRPHGKVQVMLEMAS